MVIEFENLTVFDVAFREIPELTSWAGRDENFVEIDVSRKALNDSFSHRLSCSSCLISSSLTLQLDGRCKDSLIGKIDIKEDIFIVFGNTLNSRREKFQYLGEMYVNLS